jgi:putative oxidoreductase
MRALFVLGRAMFGGFFVFNGINHFLQTRNMSQYAAANEVPQPAMMVRSTGGMLLAGGVSVIAGIKPRQGLGTLIAFLVPTTLQMHRFWEIDEPNQRMIEMTQFAKNTALIGAALALMQIPEPWPASVDALRQEDEEMFVRLGGRDLRGLPA